MAFLPYGTTVPGLSEYQMSFAGYLMGPRTNLEIKELTGIDMPAVRSGDSGRPRDHGMFRGLDVMAGREPSLTGDLRALTGTFQAAEVALDAATVPGGSEDTPLFLNLPGWGTLACMARVRKRQMPREIQLSLGQMGKVAILWAADDPRWYGPTQQASVVPPSKTAGFAFPMGFNLNFGGGSVSGSLSVRNEGNIETRPLLIVEGPCESPSITNITAPNSPNLTFNLTIASGAKLVIDTDLHTAIYYGPGSSMGSTRLGTLAYGSQWFTMEAAKTTQLQFLAATSEGQLSVQWASAWIL